MHNELIAKAMSNTGLSDFGADSFREGLEILVRALREEASLNAVGELVIYGRIVKHLEQRLQVEDWYRRHPDIEDRPIVAPLFGVGLPRTGSTALSFLLAEDPNIRYLRTWEAEQPCPPPSTVVGDDPRWAVVAESSSKMSGKRKHVPSNLHGPMECLSLMALDFRSLIFVAFGHIPSYADWLIATDMTSTYEYERRVLKLLQWGEPVKPWRLKTPAHTLCLKELYSVFPEARFVMTHRDPMQVLLSNCEIYADQFGKFSDAPVDRRYIGALNMQIWSTALERAAAFRDSEPGARIFDLDFSETQTDPIGSVRRLYKWLDEPFTEAFEQGMERWWRENSEKRDGSPRADASAYGFEPDQVNHIFADYLARSKRSGLLQGQ